MDGEARGYDEAEVRLRAVEAADLDLFFEQQLDAEANLMAAFTVKNPEDREAFMARWERILADERILARTVVVQGEVAGHVACHPWFGPPEVTYWLGRAFWGRGIGTRALALFLEACSTRPLYARAAYDNVASLRVLEKCGFVEHGRDKGFAQARGETVEEVLLRLD